MNKTYIALAFLITGFLLAGDAYGEDEVYYCAEIDLNGFQYDNRGSYRPSPIIPLKFKLKLDRASNRIKIARPGHTENHHCRAQSAGTIFICSEHFNHFNLNTDNGRFIHTSSFGYVFMDGDTIAISYGTCDKF